mgnify:FL=1
MAARTETLCQFVNTGMQSPWTPGSWEELADSDLVIQPGLHTMFAFDVDPHTRRSASLVAGCIMPDGRIGMALVKTWESQIAVDELQIAVDIKAYCDIWLPKLVLHDKYTTQAIADRLTNSGVMVEDVSGAQFYNACSIFKEGIDNRRIVHGGQPYLDEAMNNAAAKSTDSAWRVVRKKSMGSITPVIGMAMLAAHLTKPVAEAKVYM